MTVNKKTIYTLLIISFVIIVVYYITLTKGIIQDLNTIYLNVFCACLVSIVLCIVNYKTEKRRVELNIFNQAISYYSFLHSLRIISGNFFGDVKDNKYTKEQIEWYERIIDELRDRNNYFFRIDQDLDYFINNCKRKKCFNKIYYYSIGEHLYNDLRTYLISLKNNKNTIDNMENKIKELTSKEMAELDRMIIDLCDRYLKEKNWVSIKKEKSMDFLNEK